MNKRLMTNMADTNGLQRAIRPTRFFNIKKMATDFCSAQCIMDNTGSLMCGYRKYPYEPTAEGYWKFQVGGESQKPKFLKESMKKKLEFPEVRRCPKQKNLLWEGHG